MNKILPQVMKSALIVGTLDISAASLQYFIKTGKTPLNVLTYISSAIFGKEASSGGIVMIVTGLILHYVIAFAFTAFFFWLYPRLIIFRRNSILTGIVYGLFVWTIMNLIVVPLTKIPARPFSLMNSIIGALILIVCIGIPLSLMLRSFYKKKGALAVNTPYPNL